MKLAEELANKYASVVSKNTVSLAFISAALLTSLLFSSQATAQTTTTLTATRSSSFTYNAQGLLLTETIE